MKLNDLPVIKCPVCGTEYLPSEIYIPESFFGKQKEVIKNAAGEIDFYLGDDMDLNEEYICDNCGSLLRVRTNMSFDVEVGEEKTFEEEFVTEINKPSKIKLEETELF